MKIYQLIIFDVDGTFYDLDDVVADNYKMQVDFFAEVKKLPKETVKKVFDKNYILPYKSERARSATEFFLQNRININEWETYRNIHSTPYNIHKDRAVSNDLLVQYAELTKLVLLSSNTLTNIRNILNWLTIDESLFDGIFCSSSDMNDTVFCKQRMTEMIVDKYGLDARDVLAVGDRYETDIKPIVSMGGNGVLVRIPENLKEVYRDLCDGKLGRNIDSPYEFYC